MAIRSLDNESLLRMLATNRKRVAELCDSKEYDPVTGKKSPVPRFAFRLDALHTVYLPEPMMELPEVKEAMEHSSFHEYVFVKERERLGLGKKDILPEELFTDAVNALMAVRCRYDFEYWAYTCYKIRDKKTKAFVPFRLRKSQRIILKELESARLRGGTVYAILVKARQFGGSTLIQAWFFWIQNLLHENWHSSIVTDVEDQARRILDMYHHAARLYPAALGDITMSPLPGSNKSRVVKERGCIISIGSMQKPDSLRSADNALVHCSEVGLWKKTEGKEPDDLVQSLLGSISDADDTAFIMESTAKGVGNFFHQTWTSNDEFIKIFIAWFQIDLYMDNDMHFKKDFIRSMTEYEWYLWDLGATIEGISWYRKQLKRFRGDHWRMMSEYPSTPDEAFSSTGSKFYSPAIINRQRGTVCAPVFIGDVRGNAQRGKESLSGLSFEANPLMETDCLRAWIMPDDTPVSNRFVVSVDIGGRSERADYSSINVIDRIGLMYGGGLERAATWHGHIDQDLLAWKAAQIATLYGKALLVVEVNSLDSKEAEDTEGSHYLTVLDEIAPWYGNMYMRTRPEKARGERPNLYGFHMNKSTKPMVMDKKLQYMREDLYIEHDEMALHEMEILETKPDGRIGNVEGKGNHDDIEVPTATAIYVSDGMPYPSMISEYSPLRASRGSFAAAI